MNSNILRKYLSSYEKTNKLYELMNFNSNYSNNRNLFNKDSNLFCERICDDLCEVILSYLPIEEKLRLEAVSKQFQRCIYNRQTVIEVKNCELKRVNRNSLYYCLLNKSNSTFRSIDIKNFETLLRKCRFCTEFRFKSYTISNREEVLSSIIQCSQSIRKISFDFNDINTEVVVEFGLKFGQNLRQLSFVFANPVTCLDNYIILFRLCPNLTSLSKVRLKHLIGTNERLVPNLREIGLFYGKTDINFINKFVEYHKNGLRSLKINTETNTCYLNLILQEVSKFKNLEELEIWSSARILDIDKEMIENVRRIGNECRKLKKLKIMSYKVNQTNISKLFESLNSLPALKSLDLKLIFSLNLDSNRSVALKSLSACSQLRAIKLYYSGLNDKFFEDIGLYFNQLKRLSLTVDHITDKGMKSISKLKSLQYLSLDINHERSRSLGFPMVTDSGLCHVIYHCPSIESIIFFGRPNITLVTINALILLALSKPKVNFNHYFGYIERKFSTKYTPIELAFLTNLPKNLIISTELSTYFS